MIIGTGIDMIELNRIESIVKRNPQFIKKILTTDEEALYDQKQTEQAKLEFLAGRFAGKEAFAKAYGTGIGQISFQDISILTGSLGEPILFFKREASFKSHISISHSRTYAIANVILEQ
ncbi:holo-ACP synthase [Amphibacillus indicireducens]|uniref:Holo-[acyl-carrier-protein] synthase n=1 Tax=Amphibacillus indicireducens TaxID=1076330 RepID=A0ABP7VUV8_9BACI